MGSCLYLALHLFLQGDLEWAYSESCHTMTIKCQCNKHLNINIILIIVYLSQSDNICQGERSQMLLFCLFEFPFCSADWPLIGNYFTLSEVPIDLLYSSSVRSLFFHLLSSSFFPTQAFEQFFIFVAFSPWGLYSLGMALFQAAMALMFIFVLLPF